MKETVLIITEEFDPHADAVVPMLQSRGATVARLHPRRLLSGSVALTTPEVGPWSGFLRTPGGRRIDVEAVSSVWWRKPLPPDLPDGLSPSERDFAALECRHLLHGLYGLLRDRYWMSPWESIRLAGNKVLQLAEAARLGFTVPRTIVTTDPDQARAFVASCPTGAVYKAMADSMLNRREVDGQDVPGPGPGAPRPRVLMTTRVDPSRPELLDGVRATPCLLQEYVPKRLEYRVTVIGDDVFAAEIHSQDDAATATDWRNHGVGTRFSATRLPSDVASRCLHLVRRYGLEYGAIDLILTPRDEIVFLEINPNGQWLFVERMVPELRMRDALTSRLLRGRETPLGSRLTSSGAAA